MGDCSCQKPSCKKPRKELTPEEREEMIAKVKEQIRERRQKEREKAYKEAVKVRDSRYDKIYEDNRMEGMSEEAAHREAKELMEELGIYEVVMEEDDEDVSEVQKRDAEATS